MTIWKNFLSFSRDDLIGAAFLAYRFSIGAVFYGLGARCRFEPSCSQYGEESLRRHGFLKGGVLAVNRICRCHPLCKGGLDPVPEGRLNG